MKTITNQGIKKEFGYVAMGECFILHGIPCIKTYSQDKGLVQAVALTSGQMVNVDEAEYVHVLPHAIVYLNGGAS